MRSFEEILTTARTLLLQRRKLPISFFPKEEVGWDDYQGRLWLGLKRHMILSSVSHLFLQETKESLNEFFPEITVCQIQKVLRSLIRVRYYRIELPSQERASLNRLLDYPFCTAGNRLSHAVLRDTGANVGVTMEVWADAHKRSAR